jgi:hypothetical protein
MKENIVICYNSFADPAHVAAFQDSLTELLAEEGSQASISSKKVRPFQLDGQQFRVVWHGAYQFQSPDGEYKFGAADLTVKVETTDLDFDTYLKMVAARSRVLAKAYRGAMAEVLTLSMHLAKANHHLNGLSSIEYIRETLQAAVDAFPKEH